MTQKSFMLTIYVIIYKLFNCIKKLNNVYTPTRNLRQKTVFCLKFRVKIVGPEFKAKNRFFIVKTVFFREILDRNIWHIQLKGISCALGYLNSIFYELTINIFFSRMNFACVNRSVKRLLPTYLSTKIFRENIYILMIAFIFYKLNIILFMIKE